MIATQSTHRGENVLAPKFMLVLFALSLYNIGITQSLNSEGKQMELDWITPKQAGEKWGISDRRVQALCARGQIKGAVKFGLVWLIPKDVPKPIDGRTRSGRKPRKSNQENDNG